MIPALFETVFLVRLPEAETVLDALIGLATPETLINVLWGTFAGMVIGALPGLTATMGLALMTSLTYGMGGDQAILVLICLYIGTIYGGSRSAILLNIPGTPANAATAVEGYRMAEKARPPVPLASPPSPPWSAACSARSAFTCSPRRSPRGAALRLVRVFPARRLRHPDRRHHDLDRRSAERLDRRLLRPARRRSSASN